MGEIVNLRRARKERSRRDADGIAAANRAAFGRTRAEKDEQKAQGVLNERKLDAHRRDTGPSDE